MKRGDEKKAILGMFLPKLVRNAIDDRIGLQEGDVPSFTPFFVQFSFSAKQGEAFIRNTDSVSSFHRNISLLVHTFEMILVQTPDVRKRHRTQSKAKSEGWVGD